MSSRWYPLYQKGNPQLRVFLPNFWMKLVKNTYEHKDMPNRVHFIVSMGMGKYDIKNYLDKIYNIHPVEIRCHITMGKTRRVGRLQYVVKDDDYKYCVITLPEGQTFKFPEICPEEKLSTQLAEEEKAIGESKQVYSRMFENEKRKPGMPGWFS